MVGMLWYDNDPKITLEAKIERAANYYRDKYGPRPNVCRVHPSMLPRGASDSDIMLSGLLVKADKVVLRNHFLLQYRERPAS